MIICVVGRAGSGKTTAAKIISELTDMPLVEMSDFLKYITGGSKRYEMNLKKDEFEHKDPNWLWQHVEAALDDHRGHCVLSGIREPYLLHKALQRYEEVRVVGVEASDFSRYSRMCSRKDNGFISIEEFHLTENGTIEDGFVGDNTLGLPIIFSRCEQIFNADQAVDDLRTDIQAYLFDTEALKRQRTRAVRKIR